MNRSSHKRVLRNKTLLLVQNAYSGFSHPGARKMPCESEIKRVPYLPVYKSTFFDQIYTLKIRPRLIHRV